MKLTKKLAADILKLYHKYWDAYLNGKMKTMSSLMDKNCHVIGSGMGEVFKNKKAAVKYYTATSDQIADVSEMRNRKISVAPAGKNILVTEESDFYVLMEGSWIFYGQGRFSTLFAKTEKKWLIIQQHGSLPDSRTGGGEQLNTDKIKEENLRLKEAIKRRTIELEEKNRELEIEASLERVRAQAMGMNKPDDLLNICEAQFMELKQLGFSDIRNSLISIFNDDKGFFLDYDYSDFAGGSINNIEYDSNPSITDSVNKIRKGDDVLSEFSISGKELDEWNEYRQKKGEREDPRMENISAIYYYMYSIGSGAIGISNFKPVTQEQLQILKRFRNVFDLAYRRYNDIALAEAQAREAQIEAALEKIRSRSLAMHQSNELEDVAAVLFEKLYELNIVKDEAGGNASIFLYTDTSKGIDQYVATDPGLLSSPAHFHVPYSDHPITKDVVNAKESGVESFTKTYSFEEKNVFFKWSFEYSDYKRLPDHVKKFLLESKSFSRTDVFSKNSSIFIPSYAGKLLSENEIHILKRFANVFDQAYIRFLDLQKAEAQAREAQIEAALERVRARAMGMHKSEEVGEVSDILFSELNKLSLNVSGCSIVVIDDESDKMELWRARSDIAIKPFESTSFIASMDLLKKHMPGWFPTFFDALGKRKDSLIDELSGKRRLQFLNIIAEQYNYSNEEKSKLLKNTPKKIVTHYIFFKLGYLGLLSENKLSDENLSIPRRFIEVFDFAYTRFLDIKKAEAQAREAEIELALERVRARTMAMQKSEELADTAAHLFKQLNELGIKPYRCNIGIVYAENDNCQLWSTTNTGDVIPLGTFIPLTETPLFISIYSSWKSKLSHSVVKLIGKDRLEMIKYFLQFIPFSEFKPEEMTLEKISLKTSLFNNFYFKQGFIAVHTNEEVNEQELNVIQRFTKVFEQTYTRFLDLKKAEAQAREAEIELALERIRARTMAMQKSDELKEVIRLVYEQFVHLKINVDHAGFVVDYTPKGAWHFWIADEQDIPSKITHPYFESVWANQFNEAKENGTDFFATNLNFEEKNKFYNELLSYVPGLPEKSKDFYLSYPGLAATTVLFDNVSIYIENFSGTPYTDEDNKVLLRFGKVFQQTYTRFLDLQKAELQAREAQIEASLEKVRAVAMSMNKSEDLLSICEVSFKEFKKLGFDNIRNSLIHIQYDEQKYFMDYDFSDLTGGAITKIEYGSHPVVEDYLNQISSAEDAFYQGVIKEDQLEEWKEFRKNSGQIDDPRLEKATALYYHFFSIGIGDIGISTLQPIDESQIKILKRFRNVFDLAYRRYNDIALAEEQARETQIQLALERVRARTMAMHKSEELSETSFVLFEQLKELGEIAEQISIGIFNEKDNVLELYATIYGSQWKETGRFPLTKHAVHKKTYEAWKSQKKSLIIDLSGEELADFNKFKMENSTQYKSEEELPKNRWIIHSSFFSKGVLIFSTHEPRPSETLNILERFAGVFDLTYTRFLDLQKAETQARDAQIEAALERVRTNAMAMQSSDDLAKIVEIVFTELKKVGFPTIRCGIGIIESAETKKVDIWSTTLADEDLSIQISGDEVLEGHMLLDGIIEHWKNQTEFSYVLEGEDFLKYYKTIDKTNFHLPDYAQKNSSIDEKQYYYMVPCKAGGIYAFSVIPFTEEVKKLMRRFIEVFQLAFTRYVDLKKAEKQAREAEIEAALERVRSRTMAMQKSDELAETASHLFDQLNGLGIKPYRFNIAIVDSESENCQLWSTTNEGKVIPSGPLIPLKEYKVFNQMYDGWKQQQSVTVLKVEGEERIAWTKYIMKYVSFNEYRPENIDLEKLRHESAIFSNFFFKQGFIVVHTLEEIDDADIKIIQRFVNVFEQTYTRFLDLQKAESQARDAIKQAALDRIRGEIASMRTSEDLNRITPIIWRELKNLEVPFFRCGVYIVDEISEMVQVYLTSPDGKSLGVLNLSFDSNEITNNTVEHWRKKIVYKTHWDKEEFISWTETMMKLGQIKSAETYQGSTTPPESLYLHFVPFTQGMLYVGDVNPLTDEKLELVKTLAEAFSIAYARYEDFKNLEDAKNKIEITLSELKSAQAQLVHSEKMASLGELTAGIAHEIKNPLNFVNNFSEVSRELLDEMKTEIDNKNIDEVISLIEDLKQNLDKINQHGKRADSIVKGMLLHSRGTSGEKTLTDINDLLDQYVNLAYHGMRATNKEFNITIEKEYDKSTEKIKVVPQDISRVFLNIINNACYAAYYRKKKGENNFSPTLKVSTKNLNGKVEIRIGDNGNGIPADHLEKIFQPFFTTKPSGEGTGLGLSLSYDIVTKVHGGELKVETKDGEGSEFLILLPSR